MGDSLRCARCEFNIKKSDIKHCKTEKFRLPKERKSKTKKEKDNMIETVNRVFLFRNLKVNEDNKNKLFYNLQIATENHGGTSDRTYPQVYVEPTHTYTMELSLQKELKIFVVVA